MKALDNLSLPITVWQVFDDVVPTQKQIKLQFWLNMLGLPLIILIAYLGGLSWNVLFVTLCYLSVMMTIFFGFYFKVYNIKIFDNHGNLMVDKPLIAYQNCNFYSWAGVNWLSISVQNKVYRYFFS